MIPRTKHLVIGVGALILLLSLSFVGGTFARSAGSGFGSFSHEALLIHSLETVPEVIVVKDTTREDMRAELVRELEAYALTDPQPEVRTLIREVPEGMSDEVDVSENEPKVFLCESVSNTAALSSWGRVNVNVGEGARVVSSIEKDATGMSLHTLQLPLEPRVNDTEACLLSGMVGILLDGTVLAPNSPVSSPYEGLAGYARDGFSIFSQYEDGKEVVNTDLDVCHGHVHEIVDQGVVRSVYHYHITDEAPYTLGCFKGVPVSG